MYLNITVRIPKEQNGTSKKKIKGTTYIYYEHGRKYYSDKHYTVPKCTSIGKVCEDDPDMMVSNGNFLKFFPPEELPVSSRSGCIKIVSWLVIRKVIRHYRLDERIGDIIGKDAGLFLELASYDIITENNAVQYYLDYAFNHPHFTSGMHIYSDSKVSTFLRDIT